MAWEDQDQPIITKFIIGLKNNQVNTNKIIKNINNI